jgi:hypothetical protein
MEGSFHHGVMVQAGAELVAFEMKVVAVVLPEHAVTVAQALVQVWLAKVVPLIVTLAHVFVHVVKVDCEQRLVEVVETDGDWDWPLLDVDAVFSASPDVQGGPVQWVIGIVMVANSGGGTGGNGGRGGGKLYPKNPPQGTRQFLKKLKMHFTASAATPIRLPQLSVHSGPRHCQVKKGKSIQPPSTLMVVCANVADHEIVVELPRSLVMGHGVVELQTVGIWVSAQISLGTEWTKVEPSVVTGHSQPRPQLDVVGRAE